MSASDFVKRARKALGLTQTDLATTLGLAGSDAARTVRRWEDGQSAPSGPVMVALGYLSQGAPDEHMQRLLPEVMMGSAISTDDISHEIVIRLWRPRFVGVVVSAAQLAFDAEYSWVVADVEALQIAYWIDDPTVPPGWDAQQLIDRAAAACQDYTEQSFADNAADSLRLD